MKKILVLFFLALCNAVFAGDSLVLIHGYGGSANSWHKHNVTRALAADGWRVAGYGFFDYRYGVYLDRLPISGAGRIYILQVPYRAPISYQAQVVEDMLHKISKQRPDDNLHLVGHSAGGVVARLVVVGNKFAKIKTLITIASPHFGTRRAEMALDLTDLSFPFSEMAEAAGGKEYDKFQQAEGLFRDLARPRPGTFLNWLNWQSHPDINYYSIVRKRKSFFSRDLLVPTISQDMGLIPVLHDRTRTILAGKSHGLKARDGFAIARIMREVLGKPQAR